MWSGRRSVSDRGRESRAWRFYVEDMIGFCQRIGDYTAGLDKTAFVSSRMPYDATLRNIELIGEAAAHIPETVRDAHPEIPWRTSSGHATASFTPIPASTMTSFGTSFATTFPRCCRRCRNCWARRTANRWRNGRNPNPSRPSSTTRRSGATSRRLGHEQRHLPRLP